ncbi:MAG TPA: tripartite tricarboxylate transporter substrate-binding protein, partial [Burkholderiales bacterium]|nr:tripartite tricarboxylate transporter substrate-binding protein [Burkholderiales bacterium]
LGIMAPAGTPKAAIDRLNAEITKIASRPDVKKIWQEQGAVPMSMTPAEFERYLNADIAKWAKIVKLSGARPDQ